MKCNETKSLKQQLGKKNLAKLNDMTFEESKDLMSKLPLRIKLKFYAQNCTPKELRDLKTGYIENSQLKKLELLKKYVKRERRAVIL